MLQTPNINTTASRANGLTVAKQLSREDRDNA
jgi:hypothetical protein